jgi:hypothetical protein
LPVPLKAGYDIPMLKRFLIHTGLLVMLLTAPAVSRAEDVTPPDARLQGYGKNTNVVLPESSNAINNLALIFLTVVGVSVMFKSSKRSHLD